MWAVEHADHGQVEQTPLPAIESRAPPNLAPAILGDELLQRRVEAIDVRQCAIYILFAQQCRPVLEKLGQVFCSGGCGSGHAVKALNNYLSAVALAATAEAMMAAERFGIEPGAMLEILNHSTGRNTATEQKYPAFVLPRSFNSGFALGLMAKDLRIALGLAESVGTPRALLGECAALWNRAERLLGSSADNTEVVRYLER